jgi:hypothetical protein
VPDEPRLLGRGGGYTSDPKRALRGLPTDKDEHRGPARGEEAAQEAAPVEPEAVEPGELEHIAQRNRERFEEARGIELAHRRAKSRAKRLANLQTESIRLGLDVGRQLSAIERQLDLIARTVAQAKRAA